MNKAFYKYLLRFYFFSMLVLFVLRILFLVTYFSIAGQSAIKDLIFSFVIGFIIDSSVVTICISSCFLISFFIGLLFYNSYQIFFRLSFVIISLIFFINIIDIFYFGQFGVRLNQYALQEYQSPKTILPMIYNEYPVIWIVFAFSIFLYLFYILCRNNFREHLINESLKSFKWVSISFFSFFALSFLYYDGPFWKLTSYSASPLLNQMSSNGAYTFIKSIAQNSIYKKTLTIFPEIADSTAINFVKNISLHDDEISLSNKFPTQRKFKSLAIQHKKNIVIIICESFSASQIGILSGRKLSPRFDQWSSKGILFTHCYSNGPRTHFGLTSVVAGFPSIIGSSLIRKKGLNEFNTLGNILHDYGYDTKFFYGGDANFDDMKLFMQQGGFENIFDITNFKNFRFKNAMGVCDEDLFDKAYTEIFNGKSQLQLSVILTVSNHAPHHVPDYFLKSNPEVKSLNDKQSTFYYEDYAIGKFLDQCSTTAEFSNTIFLILADHGEVYELKDQNYKVYHIPALLLNSSHASGIYDSVCSQMDFASTLINESGYNGSYHFIGQNLFSSDFKPFAISRNTETALAYHYDNKVFFTDLQYGGDSYFYLDSLSYPAIKFEPSDSERSTTHEFLKKYLEGLSVIYRDGLYQYKSAH